MGRDPLFVARVFALPPFPPTTAANPRAKRADANNDDEMYFCNSLVLRRSRSRLVRETDCVGRWHRGN